MKENKHYVVTSILRFLSFISSDDSVKDKLSQVNILSALFAQLSTGDKDDKKFILSVLNDLVNRPKAVQVIKETAWLDGIDKLVACQDVEPLAASLIFSTLHRDPTIRAQINAIMELEKVNSIIKANNGTYEWTDLHIPAHIKRLASSKSLQMGALDIGLVE